MQKPENYIPRGIMENNSNLYITLFNLILQAQKDAYNEGVDDSLKNAKCIIYKKRNRYNCTVKTQSILKLKKK